MRENEEINDLTPSSEVSLQPQINQAEQTQSIASPPPPKSNKKLIISLIATVVILTIVSIGLVVILFS